MKLVADNVRKQYGSVTAVDGLSLTIPSDSTFAVLGMNGAGKTTLFRLFVGLDAPDEGRVLIGGRDVADAGHRIRRHIGYLPERISFPDVLTGREVLEFHARMRGLDDSSRIVDVLDTVGLSAGDADRRVQGYSNGMRRRLGLAGAILSNPDVLILDEPTSGLDPRGMIEFHHIVQRVRSRTGATLVVASHVLSEVEDICDHLAIIDAGDTVVSGAVEELLENEPLVLELAPADADDLPRLRTIVDDFGTARSDSDRATVHTAAGNLPELFAALRDSVELTDVVIDRRRLSALFHRQLDAGLDDLLSSDRREHSHE